MHKTGPERKAYCGRGHKFTKENTIIDKRGYRSCRACATLRAVSYKEKKKKNSKKRRENPELYEKDKRRMKERARERRLEIYGITENDFLNMVKIQDYKCAICGNQFDMENPHKTCNIDHDHKTNIVRGLLCNSCNLGLGKFKDNQELLIRAGEYLQGKRAFITGVGGQDGHYLAHLLASKGYEIHGLVRRTSTRNPMLNLLPNNVQLHEGDITDFASIYRLINEIRPHEIYNLAAQSHVGTSFKEPLHTTQVNYIGTLNILESARLVNKLQPRIYQASTSEMFGGLLGEVKCNEDTPFYPRSPYGVAKLAAHHAVINYREAYGLFACCGILFNHESPRRGTNFVTRKVTKAVADIKRGKQDKLYLGNLDSKRDWGHARDYVRGMWMMLQHHTPTEFVLATGETRSIRELCTEAFTYAGLGSYEQYVEIDPRFYRPAEVDILIGDAGKAKRLLGWEPQIGFLDLVKDMVDADLEK